MNEIIEVSKGKYKGLQVTIKNGNPLPFGSTRNHHGINFSIFSKKATHIILVISDPQSNEAFFSIDFSPQVNKTGDVWHICLDGLPEEFCYNYRVDGKYDPPNGLYFNPNNLLIDPYARVLVGGEEWGKKLEQSGIPHIDRHVPIRRSFFSDYEFDWEDDKPINRPLKDSIIYELHTRGFTNHKTSTVKYPGTFSGIIEKIPYFKKLGITAIELMPINEFDENECMFTNPVTGEKLKNFWGYSSISFFSLKASYSYNSKNFKQIDEFKEMVKALHKNEIEIILDVVFNHTAEGNQEGPSISFRGLENDVYYIMDKHHYTNYSGCGNTLNCNHPVVREMILDALRYWVTEMHVDGFRFDLASILGRDDKGHVLQNPPILEAIAKDPILANTKIIAEAWDAAGLYQVGNFPAWKRWAEWNDKYRDTLRRFLTGEPGLISEFTTRIAGSSDLYGHSERKPYHSINYITCHDGFTLMDLVSYHNKNNFENGENGNDGTNANYSWNCGFEGETSRASIIKLRKQQIKNAIALLMLSQGTPMLLAGDEFGRTQKGNNNAYCQDNDISWINWDLTTKNSDLIRFTQEMIKFRKTNSILRREIFFTGQKPYALSLPDISWHGTKLDKPDFSKDSRLIAFLISGTNLSNNTKCNDIYVAINMSKHRHLFKLPQLTNKKWHLKVNTFNSSPQDIFNINEEPVILEKGITLKAHSVIVLVSK